MCERLKKPLFFFRFFSTGPGCIWSFGPTRLHALSNPRIVPPPISSSLTFCSLAIGANWSWDRPALGAPAADGFRRRQFRRRRRRRCRRRDCSSSGSDGGGSPSPRRHLLLHWHRCCGRERAATLGWRAAPLRRGGAFGWARARHLFCLAFSSPPFRRRKRKMNFEKKKRETQSGRSPLLRTSKL